MTVGEIIFAREKQIPKEGLGASPNQGRQLVRMA